MKATERIGYEVDSWIAEDQLPVRGNLQVQKPTNQAYDGIADPATGEWILKPMDDDEIEAYREHLHWFLTKDYSLIISLPKQENDDFKIAIEKDDDLSFPFGSADFQRMYPFNKYQFRLQKIYDKVFDLATTYAVLNGSEAKKRTQERYRNLVNSEFRNRALTIATTYKKYSVWMKRDKVIDEINGLNSKIRTCKRIWKQHAYEP